MAENEPGAVVVRQPDEGESFWQPVPANGYSEVRVSKRDSEKIQGFSSGVQVIAPGCYVREHQHGSEQGIRQIKRLEDTLHGKPLGLACGGRGGVVVRVEKPSRFGDDVGLFLANFGIFWRCRYHRTCFR